jgi:hypothetical protein
MKNEVLVSTMRDRLKSIVQTEIECLPELLQTLTPRERIIVLVKLCPYVFPKTNNINADEGEPFNY